MNPNHFNQEGMTERLANDRILAVDDDPLILELFRKTFQSESRLEPELSYLFDDQQLHGELSFHLTIASQGAEAVQRVREAVEQGRPYAVLFLDERMPPGINGLETAKRVREVDPHIHIVIASAYTDHKPSEYRMVTFSRLYFIRKPLNIPEVEHMAYNACMSWNRDRQLESELNKNIAYRIWLNRLFDALPVPVVVINVENYQVIMNGGPIHAAHDAVACYQQLYGRDTPCSDADGGCPLQQVVAEGRPVVVEHRHLSRDGKSAQYELHCIPIHDELGNIHQMLEFSIDITERVQRLEEKEILVRQQKQLFDTFRSTAHTMKNSISYLNGMTERMLNIPDRSGPLGELLSEERVQLIQEQVTMIHTMLQIALGSARADASELCTLSIQQKIRETLSLFAISTLGKGKQVALELPAELPLCIRMTPIDCQTLFLNLLNNAADAVDSYLNGKLSSGDPADLQLLMEIQDQPMIGVHLSQQGEWVAVEIRNRGEPIPQAMLETIFQQGVSMKEGGNGVGLYDVSQILKQAGGEISVCNREGEVVFQLRIPRVDCNFDTVTG
jgi:signal transduction histidine kinase/FixJ family two-component response regulator